MVCICTYAADVISRQNFQDKKYCCKVLITFIVKPYPAIFFLKMSSAYYVCYKCSNTPEYFYYGSIHYEPWSEGSLRSSLIWVHIYCTIGYLSSTYAYVRGDGNCREWHTTGLDLPPSPREIHKWLYFSLGNLVWNLLEIWVQLLLEQVP